jgi:hypothetical protein
MYTHMWYHGIMAMQVAERRHYCLTVEDHQALDYLRSRLSRKTKAASMRDAIRQQNARDHAGIDACDPGGKFRLRAIYRVVHRSVRELMKGKGLLARSRRINMAERVRKWHVWVYPEDRRRLRQVMLTGHFIGESEAVRYCIRVQAILEGFVGPRSWRA